MLTRKTGFVLGAIFAAACATWAGPVADATSPEHFSSVSKTGEIQFQPAQLNLKYVSVGQLFSGSAP